MWKYLYIISLLFFLVSGVHLCLCVCVCNRCKFYEEKFHCILSHDLFLFTSAPIGESYCTFPPFYKIISDRPTNRHKSSDIQFLEIIDSVNIALSHEAGDFFLYFNCKTTIVIFFLFQSTHINYSWYIKYNFCWSLTASFIF